LGIFPGRILSRFAADLPSVPGGTLAPSRMSFIGSPVPLIWMRVGDAEVKRSQPHETQSPIRLSHTRPPARWADRPCPHSEHIWVIARRRRKTLPNPLIRRATTRGQESSRLNAASLPAQRHQPVWSHTAAKPQDSGTGRTTASRSLLPCYPTETACAGRPQPSPRLGSLHSA
jgi:hypothetical protein